MAANKLILHPTDPMRAPAAGQDPVEVLRRIGLTAKSFQLDDCRHFIPGDNFLTLITFLGCSPAIEITPPDNGGVNKAARDGRFCHIIVSDTLREPQLRADGNSRACCTLCNRIWSPFTDGYRGPGATLLQCPHCQAKNPATRLNWRRTAGVARLFVEIWGIYPAEAVPGGPLIKQLSSLTNSPWSWFYTRS